MPFVKGKAKVIAHQICEEMVEAYGAPWDVVSRWVDDDARTNRAEATAEGADHFIEEDALDSIETDDLEEILYEGYAVAIRIKMGDDWHSVAALSTKINAILYSVGEGVEKLAGRYQARETMIAGDEEVNGYYLTGISVYVRPAF